MMIISSNIHTNVSLCFQSRCRQRFEFGGTLPTAESLWGPFRSGQIWAGPLVDSSALCLHFFMGGVLCRVYSKREQQRESVQSLKPPPSFFFPQQPGMGQGGRRPPNFWYTEKKCAFDKCTIKVCVSCS